MEFGLSQEQGLLRDSVTRYLAEQVPLDRVRKFADATATKEGADDSDIWGGLTELGIPGLIVPEALGGVGLGMLDAAIVSECLGYHATPAPFLGTAIMAPTALTASGTHEDLLRDIAAGNCRVGVVFGESIAARGDAGLKWTGKSLSGKALYAIDFAADHLLVATAKHEILLVEGSARGIEKKPLPTVDRTRLTGELGFTRTPAQLVSKDAEVYTRVLDAGRVALAADTLGAAQCMVDQAVAYAKQRVQFNRVIASFQAVKHMCAQMAADLEPCHAMVWYAAHALDHIRDEARVTACHTKAHLAEVGKGIAKTATEVHGGMGFTDLVGLHYWFKRIGFNRQILGAPEQLREEAARLQGLVA